jgi:hypothetical protein
MFTNISWTDYFMAVAILLAIYYLFVGIRYYAGDIRDLLSGKRKLNLKTVMPKNSNGEYLLSNEEDSRRANASFEETTDEEFREVEHLIERLKAVIADASHKKTIPQEFKQYLCLVLKEYPSVKNSSLRSSINELLVSECQKYGAVTLTEDEVDLLWKDSM